MEVGAGSTPRANVDTEREGIAEEEGVVGPAPNVAGGGARGIAVVPALPVAKGRAVNAGPAGPADELELVATDPDRVTKGLEDMAAFNAGE
jgi:hypothetical protein